MPDDIPAVPLHFMDDETDEPQPTQQEIEDIHPMNTGKVVLPNEAKLIAHFCSLYAEFNEALNDKLPLDPFTTDQRIALYAIYAQTWGQWHV